MALVTVHCSGEECTKVRAVLRCGDAPTCRTWVEERGDNCDNWHNQLMLGWVIIAHLVCAGRPQTGLKMARPVGLGTLFLAGTGTVVMSGPCSAVFQGLRTSPDSWVRGKVQWRLVCRKSDAWTDNNRRRGFLGYRNYCTTVVMYTVRRVLVQFEEGKGRRVLRPVQAGGHLIVMGNSGKEGEGKGKGKKRWRRRRRLPDAEVERQRLEKCSLVDRMLQGAEAGLAFD